MPGNGCKTFFTCRDPPGSLGNYGHNVRTAVVAIKSVPVGGASLRLGPQGISREGVSHGLDPLNEVAVEWALRVREAGAIDTIVALTLGPADAESALRQTLALGVDEAIHVIDDQLTDTDVRLTARTIAAVATLRDASLLVLGYESLDSSSGAVPAATSAHLGWPLVSRVSDASIDIGQLTASRDLGKGQQDVMVTLPAVLSMVEGVVTPRFPKLKQVMTAKSRPITTMTAADVRLERPQRSPEIFSVNEVEQLRKKTRVLDLEAGVNELFGMLAGVSS
jgi:electron transfer flavoprotein beta subunit